MIQDIVYPNLREFMTPVGSFHIISDAGELIRFSVVKNPYNVPYAVCNENGEYIGTITTDTNYRMLVDASCLAIGTEYEIAFSKGIWEYCDSDEHTECYNTVIGDWAVGIGAFDPNDDEKTRQYFQFRKSCYEALQNPFQYDESKFIKHTVNALPTKNGFRFRLFDHSVQTIHFEIAWIRIDRFPADDYVAALGLWLT